MKFFLIALICFVFPYIQAQPSCEVPVDFAAAYQKQVQCLALDEIWDTNSPDTSEIRIPQIYSDSIMSALAAIYTSSYTNEVDSIFRIYCINGDHELNGYRSDAIYVSLDTNIAWTANWKNEMIPSGHPFIDSLLEGIPYTPELVFFGNTLRIEFDEIINLPRLVSLLDTMIGINFAEQVPNIGEQDYIDHEQELSQHKFRFVLGWGDCLSGCTGNRFWDFTANDQDCFVSYDWSATFAFEPMPGGTPQCLLSSTNNLDSSSDLKIYPNPVSDVLHLSSERQIDEVKLFNPTGSLIRRFQFSSNVVELDINFLPTGVYFLQMDGQPAIRFVLL